MTTFNFVEKKEFPNQFLAELQQASPSVQDLITELKGTVFCDFTNAEQLFTEPEIKVAGFNLREKGQPSMLMDRKPLTTQFFINQDTIMDGRTNFFISGPPPSVDPNTVTGENTYCVTNDPIWFNEHSPNGVPFISDYNNAEIGQNGKTPIVPISGSATGTGAVSGSGRFNTFILEPGSYKISFCGLIAGFPYLQNNYQSLATESTYLFEPTASLGNPSINDMNGSSVDVMLKFSTEADDVDDDPVIVHKTIGSILFYPSDYAYFRNRSIGDAIDVTITKTTEFTLTLQRRHLRGKYKKLIDSTYLNESIGFNKSIISLPGSSTPTRDSYNYLEIMRIA